MVVPALLFLALNAGGAGARGWGIPMATDIAFALGVLALLGRRVPPSLKLFLLALAIVDDIGAIVVIASSTPTPSTTLALAVAGALIAVVVVMRVAGVRASPLYALVGGAHVAGPPRDGAPRDVGRGDPRLHGAARDPCVRSRRGTSGPSPRSARR